MHCQLKKISQSYLFESVSLALLKIVIGFFIKFTFEMSKNGNKRDRMENLCLFEWLNDRRRKTCVKGYKFICLLHHFDFEY
jgi:hypothetical protein